MGNIVSFKLIYTFYCFEWIMINYFAIFHILSKSQEIRRLTDCEKCGFNADEVKIIL